MISRENGKPLTEIEHIKQSLADLISTPIGSRIMRRDYGTQLANLIDQPTSEVLYLKCYSTIYLAVLRWEPRIEISKIFISSQEQGKQVLDIEAVLTQSGQNLNMSIPISIGALT
jgi:phage baseplate assembly protein W